MNIHSPINPLDPFMVNVLSFLILFFRSVYFFFGLTLRILEVIVILVVLKGSFLQDAQPLYHGTNWPDWKVCSAQRRYSTNNFDASYIFSVKFRKSPLRNFQPFQSGKLEALGIPPRVTLRSLPGVDPGCRH